MDENEIRDILEQEETDEESDMPLIFIEEDDGEFQICIQTEDLDLIMSLDEATKFANDIAANVVAALAKEIYRENFED